MYTPKSFYTTLVLETLLDHFAKGRGIDLTVDDLPEDFSKPAACFVSLYSKAGSLRGCIGSIVPQRKTLYDEIISNTLHAAFEDKRFLPLQRGELDLINMTVELVGPLLKVTSLNELQPEVYGVMLKEKTGKVGVLLPCPGEIVTVDQQLKAACGKGGFTFTTAADFEIYRFSLACFN